VGEEESPDLSIGTAWDTNLANHHKATSTGNASMGLQRHEKILYGTSANLRIWDK